VAIAGGAAAKVVALGSTNGASSLALKYGTADFTLASATGTVMSALDTGEITYPLQSAFLATHTVAQNNATGDGTNATYNYTTEIYDQNSDYDGTNTFTAPVTGRYIFSCSIYMGGLSASHTNGSIYFIGSNRDFLINQMNYGVIRETVYGVESWSGTCQLDMDAGDTCYVRVGISGGAAGSVSFADTAVCNFSGHLFC
jgi:hypothetical protein